jgi:hypothetical protein
MKNIKTSAVDLTDLALGIVVLGIVVSIGTVILIGVRDANLTDSSTYLTSGETILATDSGAVLSNTWVSNVNNITNATGGELIQATGNYSTVISDATGVATITFEGTSPYNGTNVNASYTSYNTSSNPSWTLGNDAALGLAEYGDWFDIIVIVGIAAVILALIFMAFGGRGSAANVGGSY